MSTLPPGTYDVHIDDVSAEDDIIKFTFYMSEPDYVVADDLTPSGIADTLRMQGAIKDFVSSSGYTTSKLIDQQQRTLDKLSVTAKVFVQRSSPLRIAEPTECECGIDCLCAERRNLYQDPMDYELYRDVTSGNMERDRRRLMVAERPFEDPLASLGEAYDSYMRMYGTLQSDRNQYAKDHIADYVTAVQAEPPLPTAVAASNKRERSIQMRKAVEPGARKAHWLK